MQEKTTVKNNEFGDIVGQLDGFEINFGDIMRSFVPDILLNIQNSFYRVLMITLYFISISWLVGIIGILFVICWVFSSIIEIIAKIFDKHD